MARHPAVERVQHAGPEDQAPAPQGGLPPGSQAPVGNWVISYIEVAPGTELLTRAVQALRDGREPDLDKPLDGGIEVNLHIPALLPDDYVPDVHLRLILYKRIASARDDETLRDLQVELIDRFGLLPEPAKNLMRIAGIRARAARLGIEKIDAAAEAGYLQFGADATVDPLQLVRLVQGSRGGCRMQGADRLQFRQPMPDADARIEAIEALLAELAPVDRDRQRAAG